MCASAVSDAKPLAFRVQGEDAAVFQGNNTFLLRAVKSYLWK